jgi:hypothetical protein
MQGYTDGEEHNYVVRSGLVFLEFIELVVIQLVLEDHEEHYVYHSLKQEEEYSEDCDPNHFAFLGGLNHLEAHCYEQDYRNTRYARLSHESPALGQFVGDQDYTEEDYKSSHEWERNKRSV